jgi:hypothetical protein
MKEIKYLNFLLSSSKGSSLGSSLPWQQIFLFVQAVEVPGNFFPHREFQRIPKRSFSDSLAGAATGKMLEMAPKVSTADCLRLEGERSVGQAVFPQSSMKSRRQKRDSSSYPNFCRLALPPSSRSTRARTFTTRSPSPLALSTA